MNRKEKMDEIQRLKQELSEEKEQVSRIVERVFKTLDQHPVITLEQRNTRIRILLHDQMPIITENQLNKLKEEIGADRYSLFPSFYGGSVLGMSPNVYLVIRMEYNDEISQYEEGEE
jgi:DNA repair exonuclease SbcCD ATPase subunit